MTDFNFIIQNKFHKEDDQQVFFNDEEVSFVAGEDVDMAQILVIVGIFPSKGQAKKNGWVGEKAVVPPGFSEHVVGKLKHSVWIFNPTELNTKDWNDNAQG